MEKIKVYVVGGDTSYASWIENHELVDNLEDANIIMFTGGADVDPSLYGKRKHPETYSDLARDLKEKEIFDKIRPDQLAVGCCKGAQFLTVMNGGILIQDCYGHAISYTHTISNGKIFVDISSTHHQMMYPFDLDRNNYRILYWAEPQLSRYYGGDGIYPDDVLVEPEIVYYYTPNKPKCLAIQGHPEIMREDAPIIDILNKLIKQCLQDVQ